MRTPTCLLRQQISESGDYFALVGNFFEWVFVDYLASGMIIGWLSYALGRFLIGAWVGRHGWIERAREFLPGWRRVRAWCSADRAGRSKRRRSCSRRLRGCPTGSTASSSANCCICLAVPVLAAGYVAAVVVAFEGGRGRALLAPFAAVGRMALTNYLMQSLVIGFVLFGVGPGLALAGKIGTSAIAGIVVAFFALQVIVSRWWL